MTGDDFSFRVCDHSYLAPRCVYGGWVVAEHREFRDEDGIQLDYNELEPRTVYETEEACKTAIEEMP